MLKTVMWIAAACVAVLLALYVSRTLHFDRALEKTAPPPPVVATVAKPAAPPTPVVVEAPRSPPTPEEQQVADDAAATGMTTMEPEPEPATPPT